MGPAEAERHHQDLLDQQDHEDHEGHPEHGPAAHVGGSHCTTST